MSDPLGNTISLINISLLFAEKPVINSMENFSDPRAIWKND